MPFAEGVLASLAATGIAKAIQWAGTTISLSEPERHALKKVQEAAYEETVRALLDKNEEPAFVDHILGLLDGFVKNGKLQWLFLEVAIGQTESPIAELREKFLELGGDETSLPFSLEECFRRLSASYARHLEREAGNPNSPLFNRLSTERMAAIQTGFKSIGVVTSDTNKTVHRIEDMFVEATSSGRKTAPAGKPIVLRHSSIDGLFKGREAFLTDLHARLTARADRSAAITGKAVHGLGGIGKTRLAIEYAWRYAEAYSALLFVNADTPRNLQAGLAALTDAAALNLPEKEAREEPIRVAAVLRWLGGNPGWLLILDNADTPEAVGQVETLLGQLHSGHVLITSRHTEWSAALETVELDVLELEPAAEFLLERTKGKRHAQDSDAADARELAGELDGLALALEQAGAYIAHRRISFRDYRAAWRARRPAVRDWFNPRLMQYHHSLAMTWQTTFDVLGRGDIALLRLLAGCAPEPIPEFLLETENAENLWREATNLVEDTIPENGHEPADCRDALVNLAHYSMIRWRPEEKGILVHRVVQEILRTQIPDGQQKDWIGLTLRLFDEVPLDDPDDIRTWPLWEPLHQHIAVAVRRADDAGIPEPTARLMNQLGLFLKTKSLHEEAEPLYRRALDINEKCYGPEHPEVATVLNNLAVLLKETNRIKQAEQLIRRALKINEKHLGHEHPTVAMAISNLAMLLKETNRIDEAEPLMRRALQIDEKSYGIEHPNVARDLNNLATLLQETNRPQEAEPLMRRALDIDEKCYGPEHPKVATVLSSLASLLKETNRLDEAEPLMRRALDIDEKSYGPEHPEVATDLNNLAQLLKKTNRLEEAEPLMRKACQIDEKNYGIEHPNVARDLNNLAQLLRDTNRVDEAEPLSKRSLAILSKFTARTGHQHPHLLDAVNNYFGILREMGLKEAEIRERIGNLLAEYGLSPK